MCNLYSLNKGQDAIRKAFGVTDDRTGNRRRCPGSSPIRWHRSCAGGTVDASSA